MGMSETGIPEKCVEAGNAVRIRTVTYSAFGEMVDVSL